MHHKKVEISIWFFIGALLAVYGLLILGYGIFALSSPGSTTTVLANLHPDIWWGALLLVIGVIYCFKFKPGKSN